MKSWFINMHNLPLIIVSAIVLFLFSLNTVCKAEKNTELDSIFIPFSSVLEGTNAIVSEQGIAEGKTFSYQRIFSEALALAESHPKELISILIAGLAEVEQDIYYPAAYILRSITGQNHGYRVFSSSEERLKSQLTWQSWWLKNKNTFVIQSQLPEDSTLIIDEIPGRLFGNDDEPPGRLLHLDASGGTIIDLHNLKMPYDAVRIDDNNYFVNIIRARSVFHIDHEGSVLSRITVGGYPCSLQVLSNGNLLVAGWDDDIPGFVREFDLDGNIVWQIENLQWPWKAERLGNGNTLIADAGSKRVFELNSKGEEVWAVDELGPETTELFDQLGPVYLQRLADGNTLVSIRGTSKIIELDKTGRTVWEVGSELVKNQYSAVRLWNGNTLIADGGNFRVIEINMNKEIVWMKDGIGYPAKAYRY
jgi:Mal s 1 allergenic protein-like